MMGLFSVMFYTRAAFSVFLLFRVKLEFRADTQFAFAWANFPFFSNGEKQRSERE
jgi:hypothetical protein